MIVEIFCGIELKYYYYAFITILDYICTVFELINNRYLIILTNIE